MKYLRHGVLSPADLPSVSAPDVGEGHDAFDAAVREAEQPVHLLFLGCHGGDAVAEVALARAQGSAIAGMSVCDLCITRAARDRIDALGLKYTTFLFHPAHVMEFLAFEKHTLSFNERRIIAVSLQEMQLLEFDDVLVYHRLLVVMGRLDMVHKELFTVRKGAWARVSFGEHAQHVLNTRWAVGSSQTDTIAGPQGAAPETDPAQNQ